MSVSGFRFWVCFCFGFFSCIENLNIELMGKATIELFWFCNHNERSWLTDLPSLMLCHSDSRKALSKSIYFWDWPLEMSNLFIDYRRGLKWFYLYHSKYLNLLEWTGTKVSERNLFILEMPMLTDIDIYRHTKLPLQRSVIIF